MYKIIIDNKTFFLSLLEVADIDEATAICDECVGKNLYPKEELEKIVDSTDKFFYLVKTLTGENIGYIYYSFTDIYSIAQYAKLDVNLLRAAYFSDSNIVGKIQSVGIKEEYRKNGLAEQLVQFTLKKLRELSIEIVFIVCWKIGQVVPLKKVM